MILNDRPHILRATRSLSIGFLLCSSVFLAPFIYFLEQNYAIFLQLAVDVKPGLLSYLEREIVWLRMFFLIAGLCTFGCISFVAFRIMELLSTPFILVEEHLQAIRKNGNWSLEAPRTFSKEMDQHFLSSYRAFQQYLAKEIQKDHELLAQMDIDSLDRKNRMIVQKLMNRTRQRMGERAADASETSARFVEVEPLRRVS